MGVYWGSVLEAEDEILVVVFAAPSSLLGQLLLAVRLESGNRRRSKINEPRSSALRCRDLDVVSHGNQSSPHRDGSLFHIYVLPPSAGHAYVPLCAGLGLPAIRNFGAVQVG